MELLEDFSAKVNKYSEINEYIYIFLFLQYKSKSFFDL